MLSIPGNRYEKLSDSVIQTGKCMGLYLDYVHPRDEPRKTFLFEMKLSIWT